MRTLFFAVIALAACGDGSQAAQSKPRPVKPGEFLREAVREGLKEDRPDRDFVKECFAPKRNLFVLKCQICEQIQHGLAEYANPRAEEKSAPPAEGKGIPKDIVDDLKSPARATQLKALERLVDRYVSRHYERLGMSAEERWSMHTALEDWKKEGMKTKELGPQKDFGDFCPSCNGAAKAK